MWTFAHSRSVDPAVAVGSSMLYFAESYDMTSKLMSAWTLIIVVGCWFIQALIDEFVNLLKQAGRLHSKEKQIGMNNNVRCSILAVKLKFNQLLGNRWLLMCACPCVYIRLTVWCLSTRSCPMARWSRSLNISTRVPNTCSKYYAST